MEQEKLTIDHIRYDLRHAMKINFSICFFIGSFLFAVAFLLFMLFSGIDMPVRIWVLGLLCAGAYLYYIVRQIKKWAMLRKDLSNYYIVTDTLLRAEHKGRNERKTLEEAYHLYFPRFGHYVIPERNYLWSDSYSFTDYGVFARASSGDEFYLVISKAHKSQIVLAYNKKMFALEESPDILVMR